MSGGFPRLARSLPDLGPCLTLWWIIVLSKRQCYQRQGHDGRREHCQRAIALYEKGAEADLKTLPLQAPGLDRLIGELPAGAWTQGSGAEKGAHDGLLNGPPF
jgi:hypothetical protein